MKRYAWAVLGLGLWVAGLGVAAGPAWGQQPRPTVELKQNYPNPFNPATTIPFSLNGDVFANGHRPKVSLKVYNVLAQLVRSEEHTSELQSRLHLVCRLLLEKKKKNNTQHTLTANTSISHRTSTV